MSVLESGFVVNTPAVMRERFDDEVVVVNLESGNYYSFDGSGAAIWSLLEQGLGGAAIASVLAESAGMETAAVGPHVERFLSELVRDGLVVPGGTSASGAATALAPLPSGAFVPPVMHRYEDMQALLLLDPIHEVGDGGWPHSRAADPTSQE